MSSLAGRADRPVESDGPSEMGGMHTTSGGIATLSEQNDTDDLPAEVVAMVGTPMYEQSANFDVEAGASYATCAATQNGNPIYWDDAVATEVCGGPLVPPTTLSLWMRPHYWEPGATGEQVALKVHFDLKEIFGLPEAVMTDNTLILHDPVRPGDRISHRQVLRSVSGPKRTKLGAGRFWVIDIEYHNDRGALVGVESYTGFGYRRDDTAEEGRAS